MAKARRPRNSTGRVTPKQGGSPVRPPARGGTAGDDPGQVGRRPSNPLFLFALAGAWIVVGLVMLFQLHATWRLIPAIFSIGIGLLFLRGASATVVRHDRRRDR